MIWKLIGGLSDGQEFDPNDPPADWSGPFETPAPEWLHVHGSTNNRSVYRLISADPDEVVYQIDPERTAAARRMTSKEWDAL